MSGAIQGWWLWAPCAAYWPASSDDRYAGPWDVETDAPVLLIGTRHDPDSAYQDAAARTASLVDLEVPDRGTVCPADNKPFFYD